MWTKVTLSRIGLVCIVAVASVALALVALGVSSGATASQAVERLTSEVTPTHLVYLPIISYERVCADPPAGAVMIAGQATIYEKPAGPGIPFIVHRVWHWETRPSVIMTVTTRNDGSFCAGPLESLPSCRGTWYAITTENWYSGAILACEPGKVYTVSAEIGR